MGEVLFSYPPVVSIPSIMNGTVDVTITSSFPVDVCFQEGLYGAAGMDLSVSCNAEGFIKGNSSGDDDSWIEEYDYSYGTGGKSFLGRRFFRRDMVLSTQSLSLRSNVYSITATWSGQQIATPAENSTQSGEVTIQITWTVCPLGTFGPDCYYQLTNTSGPITTFQWYPALVTYSNNKKFLSSLTFTFDFIGTTSLQVWVRRDASPIQNGVSDFIFYVSNTSNSFNITNPETGTWFALIYPFQQMPVANFTMNVKTSQMCDSNHNLFPISSDACAQPSLIGSYGNQSNTLANGTTFGFFPGSPIMYFEWITSNLLVGVVNADYSPNPPLLYASTNGIPSSVSSEFTAATTVGQVNFLNVMSPNSSSSLWIIAVEAASEFELWAGTGCANSCSGKGSCSTQVSGANGYCYCDQYSSGFDCDITALKPVYFVFIAIAGILVLCLTIGIVSFFFIRRRKKLQTTELTPSSLYGDSYVSVDEDQLNEVWMESEQEELQSLLDGSQKQNPSVYSTRSCNFGSNGNQLTLGEEEDGGYDVELGLACKGFKPHHQQIKPYTPSTSSILLTTINAKMNRGISPSKVTAQLVPTGLKHNLNRNSSFSLLKPIVKTHYPPPFSPRIGPFSSPFSPNLSSLSKRNLTISSHYDEKSNLLFLLSSDMREFDKRRENQRYHPLPSRIVNIFVLHNNFDLHHLHHLWQAIEDTTRARSASDPTNNNQPTKYQSRYPPPMRTTLESLPSLLLTSPQAFRNQPFFSFQTIEETRV